MKTDEKQQRFWITSADGLEGVVQKEVAASDILPVEVKPGRILVDATLEQAYHFMLWSRTASRVLAEVLSVVPTYKDVRDIPEELYQAARNFDWTFIFDVSKTFAIETHVSKKLVANLQFSNLRAKDGIADAFRDATGKRPSIDTVLPDVRLHVFADEERHTFLVDVGGQSLHKRGYRQSMTDAPLKENLASALLQMASWPKSLNEQPYDALLDPMVGSGTFIIEALSSYYGQAPQQEMKLGSQGWKGQKTSMWAQLQAEAKSGFESRLNSLPMPNIYAFDADPQAMKATHKNLIAAGFGQLIPQIQLEKRTLNQLPDSIGAHQNLLVITNPPYGERLGDRSTIRALYQGLGAQLSQKAAGKTAMVLGLMAEDLDTLNLKEAQTSRLKNGNLTVYARIGMIPPPKGEAHWLQEWSPNSALNFEAGQDFANRLQKNLQQYRKQAREADVSNLRIYDADLPDYNLAIDVYGDFLHVQEYAPPKSIDPAKAKERMQQALHIIRQVTGLPRERIFIKTRERQKGQKSQYEKTGHAGKRHIVREGHAKVLVNFTDYLDTGLFLDHRPMRQRVAEYSKNKKLLNLYAYTSVASLQAAVAGASHTTSVDLSGTYLDWGKSNFALNGLTVDHPDKKHQFIEADVFEWLKDHQEKYDVIFIDPPTFSNSKKFSGTFDVQRDHASLIKRAMNRLESGGVLLFSNNFRRFEMAPELAEKFDLKEITDQTISFDFKRNAKIHRSWEIRHKKN